MAMLARGFVGSFYPRQQFCFGRREALYLGCWSALFLTLRFNDLPGLLGALITGMLP
jgi:hypothetical protein